AIPIVRLAKKFADRAEMVKAQRSCCQQRRHNQEALPQRERQRSSREILAANADQRFAVVAVDQLETGPDWQSQTSTQAFCPEIHSVLVSHRNPSLLKRTLFPKSLTWVMHSVFQMLEHGVSLTSFAMVEQTHAFTGP